MTTIRELREPHNGIMERVTDGVGVVRGFANVGFVWGGGEVLAIDTGPPRGGSVAVRTLRQHTHEPLRHIVFTHGHIDHIGGVSAFFADAQASREPRPTVWAHRWVSRRIERYTRTWGWNNELNRRHYQLPPGVDDFPREFVQPDRTFETRDELCFAGERVELHHAVGETDDATWVWLGERRVAFVGDLLIGSLPNTGIPNRVQRFTLGWADSLDAIAAKHPDFIVTGHGPSLKGDYGLEVLGETARALRCIHDSVVSRLNDGLSPDEIADAQITLPEDLVEKVYLQEIYGCVPFMVRDVLHTYAGWWGGNPALLIPAPRAIVSADVVNVAGRDALCLEAGKLFMSGETRRALHLAVLLREADPHDRDAWLMEAELCEVLAEREASFIARSFYFSAARTAREAVDELDAGTRTE